MQFCSAISFNHESACVGELAVGSQLILRGWIYCHVKQPFLYHQQNGQNSTTRMWEAKWRL